MKMIDNLKEKIDRARKKQQERGLKPEERALLLPSGSTLQAPYGGGAQQGGTEMRFSMRPATDLEIKVPDWLIKPYIEKNTIVGFSGPPKTCKSFLAIDLACSIASGQSFDGLKTAQGTVAYIAGEGHQSLALRFLAWSIHTGTPIPEGVHVSDMEAKLNTAEGLREVQDSLDKIEPAPSLVVIDTLSKNFGTGTQSSDEHMGAFVRSLTAIRRRYQCAILVLHHTPHADKTRSKGAVDFSAGIDAEYMVSKEDREVFLMNSYNKEDEGPLPLAFKVLTIPLGIFDEDGEEVTKAALEGVGAPTKKAKGGSKAFGKNQRTVRTVYFELFKQKEEELRDLGRDPEKACVAVDEWRTACKKEISKSRLSEAERTLKQEGYLEINGNIVRML